MLVTLIGVRQILVFSASRLVGVMPDNGKVLWEYPCPTYNGINAAQPLVIGDNRVFVSSGYGAGAALVELSRERRSLLRARGVAQQPDEEPVRRARCCTTGISTASTSRSSRRSTPKPGSSTGRAAATDTARSLLAGNNLIVLTEDGDLALVRAIPIRHEELARFPVLDGKTWNVPAISGGYLLVRNLAEMAAFDLRVRSEHMEHSVASGA